MWTYIAALLPPAGLLFVLYVVLKHIIEGDRRERAANLEWDRRHNVTTGDSADSQVRPKSQPRDN